MGDHEAKSIEVTPISGFILRDTTYDTLNATVKYVLPGLGTLYAALALIWGFPAPEKIVGSIVAITTFLGIILALSKRTYTKVEAAKTQTAISNLPVDGSFVVDTSNPEKDTFTLEMDTGFDKLKNQDAVVLKVKSN